MLLKARQLMRAVTLAVITNPNDVIEDFPADKMGESRIKLERKSRKVVQTLSRTGLEPVQVDKLFHLASEGVLTSISNFL